MKFQVDPDHREIIEFLAKVSKKTVEQICEEMNAEYTNKWKRRAMVYSAIVGAHITILALGAHPVWLIPTAMWIFNVYSCHKFASRVPFPTKESIREV
jgi:hypothetical protein